MHVAFTANGRCIAELVCYRFDRSAEIALRLRGAVEAFKLISFNLHIEALRRPCCESASGLSRQSKGTGWAGGPISNRTPREKP
jgi:hypothetical protein